jgi:hypothetical protein
MQYVGSVLPSVFNPDIGTHVSSVFKRWGVVWNSILTGSYAAITGPENTWPLASIAGQDLVLYGASDMGIYGPITALAVTAGQGGGQYVVNDTFSVSNSLPSSGGTGTIASVNAGGTGYLAGDTGTINGGTGDATYTVSTVDGNGAVLTFTFTGGTTYTTATNVGTTDGGDQGGSGIGFTVDIVAASGPISAAVLSLTGGTASTVTVTNAGDLYMTTVGIGTTATTGIGNGLEVDATVSTPSTGTARIKMYYTLEDEFTG